MVFRYKTGGYKFYSYIYTAREYLRTEFPVRSYLSVRML